MHFFILGAYVPLTIKGNIIVDGVLASCYPSVHHDLANIGMTPIRWFPAMIEWIFGNDKGSQTCATISEELGKLVFSDGQLGTNYKY